MDFTKKIDNKISNCKIKNYYRKYFDIKLEANYDLIFMNMSIHNAFINSDTIINFFYNINLLTSKYILCSFIDSELFKNNRIINLPFNSYIKKINKVTNYTYNEEIYEIEWIETYYSWRHKKPIKEPLVNKTLLNKKIIK